jgi:hypothetical protein
VAAQDDDSDATTSKNNQNQQTTSARRRNGGRRGANDVITQDGVLLITHDSDLSGPAALCLTAFAAFAMAEHQYRGTLFINQLGTTADGDALGHVNLALSMATGSVKLIESKLSILST